MPLQSRLNGTERWMVMGMDKIMQKVSRAEKSICGKCSHRKVCFAIDNQPCFECNQFTEEVVRGHWKEYLHSALVRWKDGEPVWADRSVYRCSRCDFGTIARHNYCPRCGANMMDGDGNG